jgi:hypothetical protein
MERSNDFDTNPLIPRSEVTSLRDHSPNLLSQHTDGPHESSPAYVSPAVFFPLVFYREGAGYGLAKARADFGEYAPEETYFDDGEERRGWFATVLNIQLPKERRPQTYRFYIAEIARRRSEYMRRERSRFPLDSRYILAITTPEGQSQAWGFPSFVTAVIAANIYNQYRDAFISPRFALLFCSEFARRSGWFSSALFSIPNRLIFLLIDAQSANGPSEHPKAVNTFASVGAVIAAYFAYTRHFRDVDAKEAAATKAEPEPLPDAGPPPEER